MNFNFESLAGVTVSFLVLPFLIVHILFAIGVLRDAKALKRTVLVGPLTWAFATLFGGVLFATAYWIVNRSNLNSDSETIIRKKRTGLPVSDDGDV